MFTKIRGVVLHSIKYSDTASIVHVFSREHGRLSFSLPRSSGRATRMKSALFMPLSLLEIEVDRLPGIECNRAKPVLPGPPLDVLPYEAVGLVRKVVKSQMRVEHDGLWSLKCTVWSKICFECVIVDA